MMQPGLTSKSEGYCTSVAVAMLLAGRNSDLIPILFESVTA